MTSLGPSKGTIISKVVFFDNRGNRPSLHYAIDISAPETTKIYAAYDGIVVDVEFRGTHYHDSSYGNYVILRHNYIDRNGQEVILFSKYNHMLQVSVKEGQRVDIGETVIGQVGNTGSSEGPHLDFQIFRSTGNSNPDKDRPWDNVATYSIDPYSNNLMEDPTYLNSSRVYDSWECGKLYYNAIKKLYETSIYTYVTNNCTSYPAYGTITITKTCTPYTLPCNSDTAKKFNCTSNPITKNVPKVGDKVTVNGIVKNSAGNYWYKVTLSDGTPAWIYCKEAGDMKTKDPYVSGSILPDSISGSKALSGTIINDGAKLTMVQGVVYDATGDIKLATDQIDISTTGNYTLKGSPVDNGLVFQNLQKYGNATYKLVIRVRRESYYLDSGYTLQKETKTLVEAGTDTFSFTTSGGSGGSTTSSYTITFQPNGGTCSTSKLTVEAGKAIGTLPESSFEEMNFVGWFTKPYGGTEVTTSTVPTGNMELFAHYENWSADTKLVFDPNGGTLPGPVYTATIDGVNRGRPEKSLVVFNKSGTKPGTNIYGREVAISATGMVTAIRDYGNENQLTVPDGGFVLSGVSGGGAPFVEKILAMDEAYVSLDYETGIVKVFDSYAGYLAETKTGREWTTYGILPVPTRDGYVFKGWNCGFGDLVNYYSSFAGINLRAEWDPSDDLFPEATLTYNGHYYELYDHNVTWAEAKALCEAMGGHLVTITDAQEQAQIVALTAQGTRGMYRIGATDAASEGTWKWVTGETFSYNNWDKNAPEPTNDKGENYSNIVAIEYSPNKQVGDWIDTENAYHPNTNWNMYYDMCNTGFICEYETICNHSYQSVVTDATCTEQGYTTHTCSRCGDSYVDGYVNAKGHDLSERVILDDANCDSEGIVQIKCSRCDYYEMGYIEAYGHSYQEVVTAPTCTEKGYTTHTCGRCGDSYVDSYVDAKGHSWDSGKVTTAATCTTAGVGTYACSTCKETKTEQIPATGHSYNAVVTAPSCTEKGYTTHTCACGDSYVDSYVDAKGHSWDSGKVTTAATCTTAGVGTYACSTCKETKTEQIPATGHSYNAVVTAPSCTEKGYTTYTCACGDSYVDTYVDAKGHDYQNGSCSRCGEKDPSISGTVTGTCGENLTWTLDDNGVLTISGTGEMTGFSAGTTEQPWCDYRNSIRHIVVEEGITSIGKYAFYLCENLETVEISDTVTTIGIAAFRECINLRELDTGDGITTIQMNTFRECKALKDLTISANVTYIDMYAFFKCESLVNITLPESLTRMSQRAFGNCTSLQKIELPKNFRLITDGTVSFDAFWGCINLEEINVSEENETLSSRNGILYNKNQTTLYAVPPASVTGEFIVPDSVYSIRQQAFFGCTDLTRIVLPLNFKFMYERVFQNCNNLTEIRFMGGVPTFRASAFEGLTATAYYPENNKAWTASAMQNYGGNITWMSFSLCAMGHSYISTKTEATCDGQGYITHVCSVCGHNYVDSYEDALGHIEILDEAVAPGCMGIGKTEGKRCERCGEVLIAQEVIPALGHVEVVDEAVPATCQSTGLTEGTHCDRCGEILVDQTVTEKLAHTEETIPAAKPTCTQTGLTEGKQCSVCGEILVAQDIVAMTTHAEVIDAAVAPTCTTTGLTEGKRCGNCGITLIPGDVVPALGHTEQTIPAVDPTCTETGLTEGVECSVCGSVIVEQTVVPAAGHRWENGVCGSCDKVCNHEYSEEIGSCTICGGTCVHEYESVAKAPTCVEQGYTTHTCTICGNHYNDAYVDALGHQWKDATCTAPRTCVACGITDGNSNGHTYQAVVTAPTCVEKGYTTYTCPCGDSYVGNYTEPAGHVQGMPVEENRTEPTCTVSGSFDMVTSCTVCYVEMNRVSAVIPATGHNYEAVVTPPTCAEDGYTTHVCSVCGDTYWNALTDKLGHALGDWVVVTAPMCTETGLQRKDCSRCDYFEEEEISATSHSYEAVVTPPTCTDDGYTMHTCVACGDTYKDTPIDKLGHDMGDWVMSNEATCMEDGLKRKDCSLCDYFEEETINALGHTVVIDEAVAPTCAETGLTEGSHCGRCGEILLAQEVIPANTHSFEMRDDQIICAVCSEELIIRFTQDYVVLVEEERLELDVSPAEFADKIIWEIEDNKESIKCESNVVTAESVGTAFVKATISEDGFEYSVRFRVDVVKAIEIKGVQLSTNKVTTELYKDEFATFEILLDLPQNYPLGADEMVITDDAAMAASGLENKSNLIKSVQFKNISDLFVLELLDDRTVQIVPTEKAMKEGVKGTPSDTVVVTLRNGQILETTEKLSLTVKKTLPKLKATIASFNSFYEGQSQKIVITGGTVTAIRENNAKNSEKTTAIPGWLELEDGCLKLNGNAPKASDKAYLLVDVDGWVDPVELTLTVKHAKKVPGIKLAATAVTVAERNASTEVELKLLCTSKTDVLKDLNITGITAPKGYSVENFNAEDGTFTLKKDGGFTSDKITLTVSYGSETKDLTLNVKTQAVKLKLSSSKVSLNKELPDQAVVEVICTTENYNFDLKDAVLTYDDKMLDIERAGNALIIKLKDGAEYGKTYPVSVSAYQNAPAVKLSVAVLKEGSAVKSTIKATGTLDVIREGTAITIKPTYTNYLNVNVDTDAVLKIYSSKDSFKKAIAEVYSKNGIFTIDSSIIGNHTLKYKAQLETKIPGKTDPIKSNQISLSVKMGAAKLTAKSSGTTLFAKDRNDRALVWFEAADASLNDVKTIKIKDAKYKDVFEIIDYRDGSFAVAFKDGKLHESIAKQLEKKASVSITLSLDVFMEGNESAKANTTQKVKLTIVK